MVQCSVGHWGAYPISVEILLETSVETALDIKFFKKSPAVAAIGISVTKRFFFRSAVGSKMSLKGTSQRKRGHLCEKDQFFREISQHILSLKQK